MDEEAQESSLGPFGRGPPPKTLLELACIRLSAAIRAKPEWDSKINQGNIVSRWKEEALGQGGGVLTPELFDFTVSYTKHLAVAERRDGIELSVTQGVYQADDLIGSETREEFMAQVRKLEDVPEADKDWHPDSQGQVLDLVHPSLFPLVYGVTRKTTGPPLPFHRWCASGEVIPRPLPSDDWRTLYRRMFGSTSFQWLPSEFDIGEDGNVHIRSYINNLHPSDHADMYKHIQKIFARFVPLFERVLTFLKKPHEALIPADEFPCYTGEPDYTDEEAYEEWMENRVPEQPTIPEEYVPPELSPVRLAGRRVQVIVKLANIELTPEKPSYPGGEWHVEGTLNERIVATGIYYYAMDNITESTLSFRQAVSEPNYEQNDSRGVLEIYGLSDEEPLNQHLGDLTVREGRCIAFPNVFQHRVSPFELKDKTRKGWRKILVFFLVDPDHRTLSTADIPPQQKSWMLKEVLKGGGIKKLNFEGLVEKVFDFLDWPMSLEQAKEYRQQLMDERKRFIGVQNEEVFERPFSLCEH